LKLEQIFVFYNMQSYQVTVQEQVKGPTILERVGIQGGCSCVLWSLEV